MKRKQIKVTVTLSLDVEETTPDALARQAFVDALQGKGWTQCPFTVVCNPRGTEADSGTSDGDDELFLCEDAVLLENAK